MPHLVPAAHGWTGGSSEHCAQAPQPAQLHLTDHGLLFAAQNSAHSLCVSAHSAHSEQPFQLHLTVQPFVLDGHQAWHRRPEFSDDRANGEATDGVTGEAAHAEHPLQPFQLHFEAHAFRLVEQKIPQKPCKAEHSEQSLQPFHRHFTSQSSVRVGQNGLQLASTEARSHTSRAPRCARPMWPRPGPARGSLLCVPSWRGWARRPARCSGA
mmetsp:Transcript_8761/g.26049  ORF Transcript_8761/g.26049 Transcript_8761/m.26049 type:complete len:211 (-) Transcript_8761:85-717(-)